MAKIKSYSLKKIFMSEQPSGFAGNPTFGGTGNYGVGGNKQLSAISKDPSVQRVADQEEKEIDQNCDDQEWRLGKFSVGGHTLLGPSDGKTTEIREQSHGVSPGPVSYGIGGGPGSLGPPNRLVNQQNHIPGDEHEDDEYLDPNLHNGRDSVMIRKEDDKDDVEELLGDLGPEHDDELTDEDLILFMRNLEETLFNPGATYQNRRGWNNTQINSLSMRKNHLDPEGKDELPDTWRPVFREPRQGHNPLAGASDAPAKKSPLCGFGVVGWPKNFVPQDYEINRGTSFEEEEENADGGLVQNPAAQTIVKEMDLLKKFIKEIFKSRAQQKYFWVKANKGGKEGKKWKKMAKEFQSSTPKKKELPQHVKKEEMTPLGDTSMNGTKAFIRSRKKVNKDNEPK